MEVDLCKREEEVAVENLIQIRDAVKYGDKVGKSSYEANYILGQYGFWDIPTGSVLPSAEFKVSP